MMVEIEWELIGRKGDEKGEREKKRVEIWKEGDKEREKNIKKVYRICYT